MLTPDPAPLAPATWRRLCPLGDWPEPVLGAVEEHLVRPEVRENLRRHDRERSYPGDVIAELHAKGVTSLFTDEARATAYHLCGLNAVAARAGGSLAISVGIPALALLPVYIAGTRAQRERAFSLLRAGETAALLLSEWEHGSDLARIETRAEAGDGGFRLSGEKHLINGGREASLLVTLARTGEAGGSRGPFAPSSELSVFFVERDETVEAIASRRTLPTPAADISGVRFRGTVVGEDALVGERGEGFSLAQRALTLSRGGIASLASGTTTAAWDLAWEYVHRRRIYAAPLVELGALRDHLLRLAALDALTSALAVKAAAVVNGLGQECGYVTAAAKFACCAMAEEAVTEGRRILGARALLDDSAYARLIRDVLAYGVFDGTTHVMLAHLRDYLRQMLRGRDAAPSDVLARTRAVYAAKPRSLMTMDHRTRRAWVPPLDARLRALHALEDGADLAPLVALAEAALSLAEELGVGGRWARDQGAAYDLVAVVARIEAVVALIELGDPRRRSALGMPPQATPLPFGDDLLRYAVASEGAGCVAQLRRLLKRAGAGPGADLEDAESTLVADSEEARSVLHRRLLDASNPEEHRA